MSSVQFQPLIQLRTLLLLVKAELVREVLDGQSAFTLQTERLGTGHAVMMAEDDWLDLKVKRLLLLVTRL